MWHRCQISTHIHKRVSFTCCVCETYLPTTLVLFTFRFSIVNSSCIFKDANCSANLLCVAAAKPTCIQKRPRDVACHVTTMGREGSAVNLNAHGFRPFLSFLESACAKGVLKKQQQHKITFTMMMIIIIITITIAITIIIISVLRIHRRSRNPLRRSCGSSSVKKLGFQSISRGLV